MWIDPKPSHTIHYQRSIPSDVAKTTRLIFVLSKSETVRILQNLKDYGVSPVHLLHAVSALAVFALNPVTDDDDLTAHVTHPTALMALSRWFVPSINIKTHFVSSMTLAPVRLAWRDLANIPDEKDRLLRALQLYKVQFDAYLSSPHTAHLAAQMARLAGPEPDASVNIASTVPTNVGNIEKMISTKWYNLGDTREPVISLLHWHMGVKVTIPACPLHMWTMNSQLTVQIHGSDHYDESVLRSYLNEIVRQIRLLGE
ncbi:hypothetical protein CERSUDRAFT_85009 [Gelatoporia subvermispora B]|uniref:O-acyltransferase WSD1 C-terminal domain-containing protein n=1 Tax=Ceriporiopsis subvermispora (strain B) TaxID=914234 RepID=M2RC34_CERS8|nr:hypothetical protein CERSUDRAFT_85009 [Gelatoporia subvermispora B]